jgi:hypothetical protein
MPYDPTLPVEGTECDAVQMRAQLTGLKTLIDAVPAVTGATVDSVTIGSGTSVSVAIIAGILHFDFTFQPGPPGEVTQAQLGTELNQAMLNTLPQTSANSNGVSTLGGTISNPPTQAEVQENRDKINELINALRR